MTKTKPYRGTQAVLRALSLLKVFTDAQPEWTLTELAQAVELNKTTTYRLLTALESEDLLARNPETDTYRLGLGIIKLGGHALRANNLRALCHPELKRLAAAAQETAALELLSGSEALVVDEVTGDRIMSGGQVMGNRSPAHATSTGKAMLAYLSPHELEAILPDPLPAMTPYTITNREALLTDLAETRARGYAMASEELEIGLVAVAAPLLNYDSHVVGALSLAGPKSRLSPERLAEIGEMVRQAAHRVSVQLGFPSEEG
jgi:IclR family transcriptional regulator, acetate operon repressor